VPPSFQTPHPQFLRGEHDLTINVTLDEHCATDRVDCANIMLRLEVSRVEHDLATVERKVIDAGHQFAAWPFQNGEF